MATFRPTQSRSCKLNFDDKFFYELPLHEETSRTLAKIAEKQKNLLSEINTADTDIFDKAYNISLDALDEMLGTGAGADIMSIYAKPSLFDVAEVINYICGEYNAEYSKLLNAQKATGTVPTTTRGRR